MGQKTLIFDSSHIWPQNDPYSAPKRPIFGLETGSETGPESVPKTGSETRTKTRFLPHLPLQLIMQKPILTAIGLAGNQRIKGQNSPKQGKKGLSTYRQFPISDPIGKMPISQSSTLCQPTYYVNVNKYFCKISYIKTMTMRRNDDYAKCSYEQSDISLNPTKGLQNASIHSTIYHRYILHRFTHSAELHFGMVGKMAKTGGKTQAIDIYRQYSP